MSFDAFAIPSNEGVEVRIIREDTGWSVFYGEVLQRNGNRFEGDVHLDPGDAFLVFVGGLSIDEARQVFCSRSERRLVATGERFSFRHEDRGFFACITNDEQFPISNTGGFPYPVNRVPLPERAAIAS